MKRLYAARFVAYAMLIAIVLILISGAVVETQREVRLMIAGFAFGLMTAAGWDALSRRYERVEPQGGIDTRPVVWDVEEPAGEAQSKESLPTR